MWNLTRERSPFSFLLRHAMLPEHDFTRDHEGEQDEEEEQDEVDDVEAAEQGEGGGDDENDDDDNNNRDRDESLENDTPTPMEAVQVLPPRDADHDDEESLGQQFSHGYHLIEGKMNQGMEDYIVAKKRNVNGYDLGLYAIFFGQSGRYVTEYLQCHLFENILREPDFWKNPVRAVKRAYKATENEILEKIQNKSRLIITQKEEDLVENRGGFVTKRLGNVPRVDGQLAMTLAFGDARLKEHITLEPDVTIQTIDTYNEFIILASDGLWKVMSNQEACDCIRDNSDAKEASKQLIKEALAWKSQDDISCIVVIF
ncbi:Phosphatase 2C family protein [Quillaja saponaria]|uniref:Phosphatase 2C family protein n=1 Tax=Quillaja saponaria TaxID=32244 RepID=A0AAD7PA86_QUISA|nr:Phosphatase 2C family protein [Quillaja saponaria]